MSTFKARGIVLLEKASGESDKTITVLFKEYGKLRLSSRGARKPKSKFLSGTQLFAYSDFVIYKGNGFYSTAQIDLIESFYEVTSNFEKMCFGTYFLELVEKTTLEGMAVDNILLLLLKTLKALSGELLEPKVIARAFELKLLDCCGLAPQTDVCCGCGCEVVGKALFSPQGTICRLCLSQSPNLAAYEISNPTLHTMEYILNSDLKTLFRFKISECVYKELEACLKLLIRSAFEDISFKALELLEDNF